MPAITLPDGSVRSYDAALSGADFVADISPGLAKAALAVRVDGVMRGLAHIIASDAHGSVDTPNDEDALELIHHDAAHVMAEAVKATGEFATFEPENDPEGWHDFGAVEIRRETVFWKLDLYEADSDFRYGAETPDNPATTMRVLTIMLARDW